MEVMKLLTPVLYRPYIRPLMRKIHSILTLFLAGARRAFTVAVLGRLPAREIETLRLSEISKQAEGPLVATIPAVSLTSGAPSAGVRIPAPVALAPVSSPLAHEGHRDRLRQQKNPCFSSQHQRLRWDTLISNYHYESRLVSTCMLLLNHSVELPVPCRTWCEQA